MLGLNPPLPCGYTHVDYLNRRSVGEVKWHRWRLGPERKFAEEITVILFSVFMPNWRDASGQSGNGLTPGKEGKERKGMALEILSSEFQPRGGAPGACSWILLRSSGKILHFSHICSLVPFCQGLDYTERGGAFSFLLFPLDAFFFSPVSPLLKASG